MNLGGERDPAWALNLSANPHATIDLAGHRLEVTARRLAGVEGERAWARWLDLQPSAEAFRELAGREIPIFVLDLAAVADGGSRQGHEDAP